jgi:hypothetical protein
MRMLAAPKYTQLTDTSSRLTENAVIPICTFKYKTEAISEGVTLFLSLMKV